MTGLQLIKVAAPVSADDFAAIEAQFHILFPSTLKEHYLHHNGGVPDGFKMYYVPKGVSPADANEVTFNGFYPIRHKDRPKEATLEEKYVDFGERQALFDPKKYIPFGFDVSGFPLLMDFEKQRVFLLNRDVTDDADNEAIEFVANSLEEFIDGLMGEDEYENGL